MKRLMLVLVLTGCGPHVSESSHGPTPAQVSHPVEESSLATVRLTSDAVRRLGITTSTVSDVPVAATRLVGGDVIVPPGRTIALSAPSSGMVRSVGRIEVAPGTVVRRGDALLRLVPMGPIDRDVRARTDREVAVATAQLEAADARLARVERLLAENASSQRGLEEARAARDVAHADLDAAEARARTTNASPLLADVAMVIRAPVDGVVRTMNVASNQVVAAGAPLLELVSVATLEVRVPVYVGDLARLADGPIRIRSLGAAPGKESVEATPIAGPPTSAPDQATVDRFYAIAPGATFAPGERVLAELPMRVEGPGLSVPFASVVYDASGAAWVYACGDAPGAYVRTRVDPIRRVGDRLAIARGPAAGTCVVAIGAAEVFGSEFPPGH